MAVGTSLILIAIGAILAFAVDAQVSGLDINAVGAILMIVGIIGMAFSLLFLASFGPFYNGGGPVTAPQQRTRTSNCRRGASAEAGAYTSRPLLCRRARSDR